MRMGRVVLNADVPIMDCRNDHGDILELHKTGRWYYLTLTDGATGDFEISQRYETMERASKDYNDIAYLIARNLYSFDYRKQLMK